MYPRQPEGGANSAVACAAAISGVDRLFVLGGVQALAAMAFGLLGQEPVNMIVGAGNAFVAEAKRQLFGVVAIDLLAGPSEVAVIADDTADAELVAADLLGQAEHGLNSPAALVTTSERLGRAVIAAVDRQLLGLSTREICGPAWRNYGSLFLGEWSTVAYSDKGMAGTNHTLPTAGGTKHSAGLSESRFLKPLTYQRISRVATMSPAPAVEIISSSGGMTAHQATASMRIARLTAESSARNAE